MRPILSRGIVRSAIMMLIAATMIIAQTGCSGTGQTSSGQTAPEPVTGDNYFLDTVCTISIYAVRDDSGQIRSASGMREAAEAAIDDAFARCAELDKMLSRTQEASEISRVNNAGGVWTEVSDETMELVKAGLEYSELSGGDFDITVGGVTDLWDFHADPEDAKVPDAAGLKEAVEHVGYNNIEINGNKLRLKDPETKIDLGGIAKGYIGDRMTEVLEADGVVSAIINLGGNVICIGGKYTGEESDAEDNAAAQTGTSDFVIGVEAPFSDRTEIVGRINARDMTLVTSGVYERKIEVDGELYHHILSTKTGYSVDTDLDAVTLVADKGRSMDTDALSTICLIKGSGEGVKLIESIDGVEAVFILHDGSTVQTSGMEFEPEQ